ncbi:MAG: glycosyltransferase family 87 protein [Jatrophihabitans sp.]
MDPIEWRAAVSPRDARGSTRSAAGGSTAAPSGHGGRALAVQFVVAGACAAAIWGLFLRGFGPADLQVFVRAGHAVAHGLSPYVAPNSPSVWSGHAFVYPYLVAWCFAPLSAFSSAIAGLVYYLSSIVALLLTVRVVRGPAPGLVPILVTLTAEPVVRALQLGTLNVWLLLGLALAWRHRHGVSVLVCALAAVIVAKLFLVPMLAWLVLTRRVRVAAVTAFLSVALVVVGCGLADLSVPSFARMLALLSAHEGPHSSSITALFHRLGVNGAPATVLALVGAAALVIGGVVVHRRRGDEAALFCACLLASLVASPIVWSHYFALLLLIPLTMQWRSRSLLGFWAVTWLVSTPVGVPALHALHPFPGAGWVWGGAAVVGVLAWRYRHLVTTGSDLGFPSHSVDTGPRD